MISGMPWATPTVQATFAGYPGTTGLSAIDYRLTDPYLDPPGVHDDHYSEESVRFLQEHSTKLTTPRIRELLQRNSNDRTCRQHLAILYLTDTTPLGEVYQILTDTSVASERALDLADLQRGIVEHHTE